MMNFFGDFLVRSLAELVWPIIKDLLNVSVIPRLEWLAEQLKVQFDFSKTYQSQQATEKAKDAEEKANAARTPEEVAKYKAVAEVWQEVAQGLEKKNQELKKDAEKSAQNVVTEAELEKYKAMASEWREAYQNSQKEIERLSKELENIQQSVTNFKESFATAQMSDVIDSSNPQHIKLKKDSPLLNPYRDNTQQ